MKTVFVLLLLIVWSPNHGITKTSSIIKSIEQHNMNVPDCFAKYVNSRLSYKNVVFYEEHGNDYEGDSEMMAYIAKCLMDTGRHAVFRRTCQQSRTCIKHSLVTIPYQYLIYAKSANQIELIIHQCLCNEFTHKTQFIIVAPSTANFEQMLDILEDHISMKNTMIITKSEDNIALYFRQPRCPSEMESKNETVKRVSYPCASINEVLSTPSSHGGGSDLKNPLQCKMRFGIRTAAPYTFLLSPKTNPDMTLLLGVEPVVVAVLLGMDRSRLQNVLKLTGSLGYYNLKTHEGYGLVKSLYDRKIDLIMGALTYYENDFGLEMSYPLFYTVQQAVVLKQKNLNIFYLFRIFRWDVWVAVILVKLFLIFMSYVLKNKKRKAGSRSSSSMFTILLYFFAILFGKDIPMKQKNLKFVFLSWILVSFFLRTSMEAMLRNILASRDKYNQIDSLAEICNDGYKIFVTEINYSNFKNGFSVSDCFIPPENFLLVKSPLQNLTSADSHKFAAFMYKGVFDYEKWNFATDLNENELPFHVLKERINNVPLVYFFNRGDVLAQRFRDNAMRVYQGGLVGYYESFSDYYVFLHNIHALNWETRMGMTMGHVEAVFYLHMCGCLLAFAAFLGEIAYYKFAKNQPVF